MPLFAIFEPITYNVLKLMGVSLISTFDSIEPITYNVLKLSLLSIIKPAPF